MKNEENYLGKVKKWKILKTGQKLIGKIERNWKILNNLKYYIQVCLEKNQGKICSTQFSIINLQNTRQPHIV